MLLSRYSDYSVRLLMRLAANQGGFLTVNEAARQGNMSKNHLMKITRHLSQLGYIRTVRGKGGGMKLARDPASIRIGDVVCHMEPTLEIVNCERLDCPLTGNCRFKKALTEAQTAFIEVLNRYTLADFVTNSRQLMRLFRIADAN